MKNCAFLSSDIPQGIPCDDYLAEDPLAALGWSVRTVPWKAAGTDWSAFDLVVIRSTWDYQDDPDRFLKILREIEEAGTPVENPPAMAAWNLDKIYLHDLEDKGIPIVPTLFGRGPGNLGALFSDLNTRELVIKPRIGASALDTFRVAASQDLSQVAETFRDRDWMAQPFVESILTRGEFSLFHFDGELSHVIAKRPGRGDFRVQEEYGGMNTLVERPEPEMAGVADAVLACLDQMPLYARTDLVEWQGGICLMELELIEPSLYLRMEKTAGQRFARALARRYP